MPNLKIYLGCYVGNNTGESYTPNVLRLYASLLEHDMYGGWAQRSSCRVDSNRNYLIGMFLDSDATHLMIIDEDVSHPYLAPIVLAKRDLPIVCGLYFKRDFRGYHHPMFYKNIGEGEDTRMGYPKASYPDTYSPLPFTGEVSEFLAAQRIPESLGRTPLVLANPDKTWPHDKSLLSIDASGFGCVMIRRDALEAMEPPYLLDEPGLNGDLVFYRNARRLGIEVWGDMSVICTHRQAVDIGVADFSQFLWRGVEEPKNAPLTKNAALT